MRFIYTKPFAIFFSCLVLVTVLVFLQSSNRLDPVKKFFLLLPKPIVKITKNITSPIISFFSTAYRLNKIVSENKDLSYKVSTLESQMVILDQERSENETLRKELGFISSSKLELVPCSVLAKNIFGTADSLALNCGNRQGVKEGQAIISQGTMVGKIINSGPDTSTAILAVSADFSADARISQNGAEGILKGSFGSGMVLEQLPQATQLEKGWLVTTAGINENIPKNILIGEISEVISQPNDLLKKATVINPINFNNLEFIFVVK